MAEDLLGVALEAAAGGSGVVGRPRLDKGIDLYLRRLRTMLTVPLQVKASLLVGPDGAVTHYVPEADLRALAGGFIAFVHIPAPHDQLYARLFLIPDHEFRKRCALVSYHRIACYRFTAQFAGSVDAEWSRHAIDIDRLSAWIATIPGWTEPLTHLRTLPPEEGLTKAEGHNIGDLGCLWASSELQRIALDRVMIVEDRVRLDPVTFLVHDLKTQRFAGLHLRTAIFNETRRIHFDVKRHHFFADPDLWVVLVLLRPDRRVHDYVLLIPSADIPKLGFSETLTLDPLTRRFRKYQLPADNFGKEFLERAFATSGVRGPSVLPWTLRKAS